MCDRKKRKENWLGEITSDYWISTVMNYESDGRNGMFFSSQIGLVEWEWLETLSTIDPEAVTYKDYVDVGTELAKQLREKDVSGKNNTTFCLVC